jgi:hypothetical protein
MTWQASAGKTSVSVSGDLAGSHEYWRGAELIFDSAHVLAFSALRLVSDDPPVFNMHDPVGKWYCVTSNAGPNGAA